MSGNSEYNKEFLTTILMLVEERFIVSQLGGDRYRIGSIKFLLD